MGENKVGALKSKVGVMVEPGLKSGTGLLFLGLGLRGSLGAKV